MPTIKISTRTYGSAGPLFLPSTKRGVARRFNSPNARASRRRSGLLHLGDEVTFRARHFGSWQTLTSKIAEYHAPVYFCDEMQQDAFKTMRHEHHFEPDGPATIMQDVFQFTSPLGVLGKIADTLVLSAYLRRFLQQRGAVIKHYAETNAWQTVLPAGS